MINLTNTEREKFKDILRIALDERALKAEFNRAMKAKATEPGDHQSAVLGTYAGLLKEIMDENERPVQNASNIATMPSLEELKAKYLGKGPK